MAYTPPAGKKFYLFGYPIAHSVAPALHNFCFAAWGTDIEQNTYELCSTSKVTLEVLGMLMAEECGGAAVTMPIKSLFLSLLDEISPESKITGACNTIVKVGTKLVAQNTDILGVRNALLRTLRLQQPDIPIPPESFYPSTLHVAGLVIGGGATTRSAAHALTLLGLSPIFLINRDEEEVHAVQQSMPQIKFVHLRNPVDVEEYLVGEGKPLLVMGVGAIPAIAPVTKEERMVYTTASAVFTVPYGRPAPVEGSGMPVPMKRIFLEMAYMPRNTPMLQVAKAHGWDAVDGVQAMIEQGLAQQRMWYTSTPTIAVGSDGNVLSPAVERAARDMCENLKEVVVCEPEIDMACK